MWSIWHCNTVKMTFRIYTHYMTQLVEKLGESMILKREFFIIFGHKILKYHQIRCSLINMTRKLLVTTVCIQVEQTPDKPYKIILIWPLCLPGINTRKQQELGGTAGTSVSIIYKWPSLSKRCVCSGDKEMRCRRILQFLRFSLLIRFWLCSS